MNLKVAALLVGLALAGTASAQHDAELDHANNNVANTASLQRGAKYFVNYCLGCHSAQYVRYNRVATDLGLTEDELVENLMFTGERPFDTMNSALREEDAVRWFRVAPPDLSLIARSRGTDYIYNFLRGFYADDSTLTGTNNLWLNNTAMPDVFWQLQGIRQPEFGGGEESDGAVHLEIVRPGELSTAEFDGVVRDIVNFLDYIGEPIQVQRRALGVRVIGFLLLFLVLSYMLKREIWKDVH